MYAESGALNLNKNISNQSLYLNLFNLFINFSSLWLIHTNINLAIFKCIAMKTAPLF